MKFIKFVATIVIVVLALIFIVPLFIKPDFAFERTATIAKPAAQVQAYVSDFRTWKAWSPWAVTEPTAEWVFSGEPGKVGSSMAWNGKEVGSGGMTILNIEPARSIRSRIVFREPMDSEAFDVWYFETQADGSTRVTWRHESVQAYPLGRLFSIVLDDMLAPDFEKGLARLKAVLEAPAP